MCVCVCFAIYYITHAWRLYSYLGIYALHMFAHSREQAERAVITPSYSKDHLEHTQHATDAHRGYSMGNSSRAGSQQSHTGTTHNTAHTVNTDYSLSQQSGAGAGAGAAASYSEKKRFKERHSRNSDRQRQVRRRNSTQQHQHQYQQSESRESVSRGNRQIESCMKVICYPFECVGRNALGIYMLAESGVVNWFFEIFYYNKPKNSLANVLWPTGVFWGPNDDDDHLPHHASYSGTVMAWTLAYCAFWTLVAMYLHRNKMYYVV